MADLPAKPTPRPKLKLIDKKNFLGGENLNKLKTILKDADKFVDGAKERVKEAEEVFDRIKNLTGKFEDVADNMKRVADLNQQAFELMIEQMKGAINGTPKGDDSHGE